MTFPCNPGHASPVGPALAGVVDAGTEHVAQGVHRLDPHQRVAVGLHLTQGQRVMHRVIDEIEKGVQDEIAPLGVDRTRVA